MNIRSLLEHRYPLVDPYKSKHGEVNVPFQSDRVVGIELEMENFSEDIPSAFGGVNFTTDGSLRNYGIEAVTKPIPIKNVPPFLNAFFKKFEITDSNYTDRCSTHVHFNVQDITLEQLKSICLVYQTVERLLFKFVGNERDKSIFCVPWYQSGLTWNIVNKLNLSIFESTRRWMKYSALNLIPVATQGTLEFRHLHGTCDTKLITQWIHLIAGIFEYSINTVGIQVEEEIIVMNTISNYTEWLHRIFKDQSSSFNMNHETEQSLVRGVIDSKLMLETSKSPSKFYTFNF